MPGLGLRLWEARCSTTPSTPTAKASTAAQLRSRSRSRKSAHAAMRERRVAQAFGQDARAAIAAYLRSGRSGTCRLSRSTSAKPAASRRAENTSAGQRKAPMILWSNSATVSSLSKNPTTSTPEGARSRRNSTSALSSAEGARWIVEYQDRGRRPRCGQEDPARSSSPLGSRALDGWRGRGRRTPEPCRLR
ncbi:MAG: hypothetical protein JWP95_1514 [Actinotalea sp.]|nr:hypothetical protein [Actinotalea sp.]